MTETATAHGACTAARRCLACRLNHAMDMIEAAKIEQGTSNRVQFTHGGDEITGTVIRYGRYTQRGKGTVDYFLDVRLTGDEARRYRMSEVTDMRSAPLPGVLPECANREFTPGGRCTVCRVHHSNHEEN